MDLASDVQLCRCSDRHLLLEGAYLAVRGAVQDRGFVAKVTESEVIVA